MEGRAALKHEGVGDAALDADQRATSKVSVLGQYFAVAWRQKRRFGRVDGKAHDADIVARGRQNRRKDDLAVAKSLEPNSLHGAPRMRGGRNIDVGHILALDCYGVQNHGVAAIFLVDAPARKIAADAGAGRLLVTRIDQQNDADDAARILEEIAVFGETLERWALRHPRHRPRPIGPKSIRKTTAQAIYHGLDIRLLDQAAANILSLRGQH